jgi:predicted O-linked N-acetylglucosamine transferase (SPINDLY family)
MHLLGVSLKQRGEFDAAREFMQKSILLEPRNAAFHNNYGALLLDLGRNDEAMQAFEKAVNLQPAFPDALSNLGMTLARCGNYDRAASLYDRALALAPTHLDTLKRYGRLCHTQGRDSEAVAWYQRAIDARPLQADLWVELGNAQRAAADFAGAIETYNRALQLVSSTGGAHIGLGETCSDVEEFDRAAHHFAQASRLRPENQLWKLRSALCCPVIFQSTADITSYRDRLHEVLDDLLAQPASCKPIELLAAGVYPPFNITHHGLDNRELKTKFARLFAPSFPAKRLVPLRSGKRRIGFVVTRGHEGIFLRCMAPALNVLDARWFDLAIFCSYAGLETIRTAIDRSEIELVALPEHYDSALKKISSAECDFLFHWEIATDPLNYFLAFERLSPIQLTSWGMPETSGIPTIDYYLGSRHVEADGAEQFYTERLWLLDSLLTHQRRVAPPTPADREHFGLPASGSLYLCPQRLQKYHPDFDDLIGAILRSDPNGHFIAVTGKPASTNALKQRFSRTLADVIDRVHFLPRQALDDYYRLLQLADVILDPPHYSAGSSSYDFFSFNLPVVTLPGPLQASRYTMAYYNQMGLGELVPTTPEAYVQLAIRIANDPPFRRSIMDQLAHGGDRIFGVRDYVDQIGAFLSHTPDYLS